MSKTTLIKKAGAVVSCDGDDTVYYDCDILIQGPEIMRIAKNVKEPSDEIIDAGGKFIYPGLVNTHHPMKC